ncbi:MAG TPA: protein translocase subunit SecF [Chitinivibrionales bacterium]|jgi:preprotein translocase subunit SecF|nr:protein translocase subunit SecF [Chitinivibrionales bacterium]
MIQIFKKVPNINFIGVWKIAFSISGTLLLITIGSIIYHKGFNTSIEFTGGTEIQLKFEKPIGRDLTKIRSIVTSLGLGQPEIKTIGAEKNNEIQVTVKKQAEGTTVGDMVKAAFSKGYTENKFEVRREEKVGPKIGSELASKAFWAVVLALVGIVIYMGIRFNIPYGLGGVLSLFHDVFITLGFFSLTNREISLGIIAALLTIVGYSLNDTIVVFDRVRENMGGRLLGPNVESMINKSINQTLSRTIITTGTVLFVLIAFSFFGGQVIQDFSLAMLVGCSSGVYSTVYIASPIVLWWNKQFPPKLK